MHNLCVVPTGRVLYYYCIYCIIDTLLYVPTRIHTHARTHTHTHVVSGPVITNVTDTDVVTFVGDTVQLRCTAAGSPAPSYRWLKDQAAVTGGE